MSKAGHAEIHMLPAALMLLSAITMFICTLRINIVMCVLTAAGYVATQHAGARHN